MTKRPAGGNDEAGPRAPASPQAGFRASPARPGCWFPLPVRGGLAALSLPLSLLGEGPVTGSALLVAEGHATVTGAMHLGGGSSTPYPFPLGWYWVGTLLAGHLVIAGRVRWRERTARTRTPLRGYLLTGLALAALTAAVPLLARGTSVQAVSGPEWTWLADFWRLGTAALAGMAISLAGLAWLWRSRGLAAVTAVCVVAVILAGWAGLQQGVALAVSYPGADPAVSLPALVLLLAGTAALLPAARRRLRTAA